MRLAVFGAAGRMGRTLIGLLGQFPGLVLHAAIVAPGHAGLGRDSGREADAAANSVPFLADGSTEAMARLAGAQLAIDFSRAQASAAHLAACVAQRVPLLLGTTGLPVSLEGALDQAARKIPLLVAANTSRGVAVLIELVERAARALPESFDIEIAETHHRHKLDAPSGTALSLGAAAARGRDRPVDATPRLHGGAISAPRPVGEIAYAVQRGGDVVGEHTVHFIGAGERLALTHAATDRSVFARGALQAALWLAGQPAGRYRMIDSLAEK